MKIYSHSVEKLADLIPYVNNSRTHSDEQVNQVASSIKEFGFTNPVLIDEHGGVIAGHGRIMAAKKLGLTEAPCITLSGLTEAQKKAYVIADNQLALNSGWDVDKLKLEIEGLKEVDFDIDLLGFEDDFLADLLAPELEEGLTDEDAVPEAPENPVTVEGDIWQLGSHRLMCGDSTIAATISKALDGNLADLWLTDPPYNVAYEGKTGDSLTIKNDKMKDGDFAVFLKDCYQSAMENLKEGAVFYIWHANNESYNFQKAAIDAGMTVRQHLVWKKSSMVLGRQDYHYKHEPCLYGWKEGASHLWAADRAQTTILEFDKPSRNGVHPTMKPVELFEYQIKNNTKGSDIVLDSFGGSGTSVIASEKAGRRCVAVELDPKYCDVIINRWQDFTGKQAIHIESGKTYKELADG